ncbi:scarecrow-like protein 22 [Phoenix dactylifera]|uniref:Scarecrow-like protein 22 n=1 Tax=Phoenix dactylifera TaxID=42345 RepID=A0A8B7CDP2_PHODC|nr:scarecrow-like protein 22 [Phoenix dactylifera]
MPFSGKGKRFLEVVGEAGQGEEAIFVGENKKQRRIGGIEGLEPRSVLETRRSLSPPSSTSTLSSSLCCGGGGGGGGGGGSFDTASVAAAAAVSDAPAAHRWPISEECGGAGSQRKEEWAAELQPITAGLDLGFDGDDKGGLGVEDWEAVFSEPAAYPDQDQTFLGWIMGNVEDPPTSSAAAGGGGPRQQPQFSPGPAEFNGHNAGLGFGGLADTGFGLETTGGMGGALLFSPSSSTLPPPPPLFSSSDLSSGGRGLSLSSSNTSACSSGIPPPPPSPGDQATTFGRQTSHTLHSPTPSPAAAVGMFLQKPNCSSNPLLNRQLQFLSPSNPAFFVPVTSIAADPAAHQPPPPPQLLPPQHKRRQSMVSNPAGQIPSRPPFPKPSGTPDLFLQRSHLGQQHSQGSPLSHLLSAQGDDAAAQQQQQALVDELFEAAKMVEAGDSFGARGILARLNHQLPSPQGKPLLRSAFYFKETLHRILGDPSDSHARRVFPSNPITGSLEAVLKLTSLKAFSEVSPILMFTNVTCIQALLEGLAGADRIHIVDFDIGSGTHWSAFMQELAQRSCTDGGGPPMLRITAFVSPEAYHPLELNLACGTLAFWAGRLNIPFEFSVMNLDNFDPSAVRNLVDAPIAVNLPVGSAHNLSPTLLRLVKQLTPKVVVSVDLGCDRSEMPFSHHFLHAFQSCMVLLDSIDAAVTDREVTTNIEWFIVQPWIESSVLGRHRAANKMLPWRMLFASAGFVPLQFSSATESQADCLLQRVPVRGFHVETHQDSLFLYWQHRELVSVSAWGC